MLVSGPFATIFLNRKNEVSQTCASLLCFRTIESKAKITLMTDENDSARTMAQAKEILFNSFVRSFISFWLNSWFFSTQRESCRIELHSCSQYSFIFFEHMKWKKKVMIKKCLSVRVYWLSFYRWQHWFGNHFFFSSFIQPRMNGCAQQSYFILSIPIFRVWCTLGHTHTCCCDNHIYPSGIEIEWKRHSHNRHFKLWSIVFQSHRFELHI